MPELEEGNLWIRGTGPLNQTLERNVEIAKQARTIMASFPEVETVVSQSGRPDDGTDTEGYEGTEYFVPVRPFKDWPAVMEETDWLKRWLFGPMRPRTKVELTDDMDAELEAKIPGVNWNFSQDIRDNVMEAPLGDQGRQLGENRRARHRPVGAAGRQGQERNGPGPRHEGRGHLPHPRAVPFGIQESIRRNARSGA